MVKKLQQDEAPPSESKRPTTPETLSGRVLYALELRQMSRQGLEEEARLSRGYVSRIVKGERLKLSPELMRRVSDALGISYEWLATGRGDINDLSGGSLAANPVATQRSKSFPLEAAIAYHEGKWSAPAVAAARAMVNSPGADELGPPDWAAILDQVEAALVKIPIRKRF